MRIIVGVMYIIYGFYDIIWPDAATSQATVDLRDFAVDAFFVCVGTILVLTAFSVAPEFIEAYFGFMKKDFGAGACIVFSSFMTTNAFQLGHYSTYCAIAGFCVGPVLMTAPLLRYCFEWEQAGDAASTGEKTPLIDGTSSDATEADSSKAETPKPENLPDDAL